MYSEFYYLQIFPHAGLFMIYAVTIRSISEETVTLWGLFVHGNEADSCVVGGCHRAGPNKWAKNIKWAHKGEKEKSTGPWTHCLAAFLTLCHQRSIAAAIMGPNLMNSGSYFLPAQAFTGKGLFLSKTDPVCVNALQRRLVWPSRRSSRLWNQFCIVAKLQNYALRKPNRHFFPPH